MTAIEDSTSDDDYRLIFRPLAIWIVVICYSIAGIGLFAYHYVKGTALLAPIDPLFRSLMVGAGAFVGVWLAAVIWDAWKTGITFRGPVPQGVYAIVQLLALVVASGFAGGFIAHVLVEWRAFRGFEPAAKQEASTSSSITSEFTHRTGWTSRRLRARASHSTAPCEPAAASRKEASSSFRSRPAEAA